MKLNEYNCIEDFVYEYESGRSIPSDKLDRRKYMGIEFKFNGIYYRMCREPIDETDVVVLDDGRVARFDVMVMHCEKIGYPLAESFELIGWYADLNDVLENCILQNKQFKDVIMDDNTEILGKD